MRFLPLLAVLCGAVLLAGCTSTGDGGAGLSDLGTSISGGVGRDTLGTQRRVDVYGGSTAPSLPSSSGGAGYR